MNEEKLKVPEDWEIGDGIIDNSTTYYSGLMELEAISPCRTEIIVSIGHDWQKLVYDTNLVNRSKEHTDLKELAEKWKSQTLK